MDWLEAIPVVLVLLGGQWLIERYWAKRRKANTDRFADLVDRHTESNATLAARMTEHTDITNALIVALRDRDTAAFYASVARMKKLVDRGVN